MGLLGMERGAVFASGGTWTGRHLRDEQGRGNSGGLGSGLERLEHGCGKLANDVWSATEACIIGWRAMWKKLREAAQARGAALVSSA